MLLPCCETEVKNSRRVFPRLFFIGFFAADLGISRDDILCHLVKWGGDEKSNENKF